MQSNKKSGSFAIAKPPLSIKKPTVRRFFMKNKFLFLLALLLILTSFVACNNSRKSSDAEDFEISLTEILGEEMPHKTEIDFAQLNDDELSYYTEGYEALKNEITGSMSTVEITEESTVYYVSSINGNDDNDGLSPETAWKNVKKANIKAVRDGDIVLFERGSIFREQLSLSMGVTYSSYGFGAKPRFYGSWAAADPELWLETDTENIYCFKYPVPESSDIGQIVFNDGEMWGIKVMKRNHEDLRVDQGECFNGRESFNEGSAEFTGWKDLKNNLEFYCDPNEQKMYLYCVDGNPGDVFKSIEVAKRANLASGSAKDVVIDNLCFMYGGSHGIGVSNAKNFEVKYCEFYYIGGSIQGYNIFSGEQPTRFGNAIENWERCENFKIHHCLASQIYDCCFTTQWQGDSNGSDVIMKDVEFAYNIGEYSNTGLEIWMSDNVGYPNATYKFEDFDMHHNYTVNNGYGWSHQRPNKNGNFFYGGTNHNSTQHVNSVFHDNVNMFASKYGILAHFVCGAPYAHTFKDNVYIMEYDTVFANSAIVENGTVMSENGNYRFTEDGIRAAVDCGVDVTSKFRYTLPEGVFEIEPKDERLSFEEYIKYNPHYLYKAKSGNVYPVSIIKPESFDEEREYPLIVYLHAEYQGGDNGTSHVLNNNPLLMAMYTRAQDDDAIILAMQVPRDSAWTSTDVKALVYEYSEENVPIRISDLDALVDYVASGKAGVKIDISNMSIVGQSNGGTAVYDILTRYPDKYVRAAVGGAATMPGTSIGNTSLKVYHGGFDIYFDKGDINDFVKTISGDVGFVLLESEDHNVWRRGFDHDLAMWLIGK